MKVSDARPHPGLLPQEKENRPVSHGGGAELVPSLDGDHFAPPAGRDRTLTSLNHTTSPGS